MNKSSQIRVRPANLEDADCLIAFSVAMAKETENRRLNEARLREGVLTVLSDSNRGMFIVAEAERNKQRSLVGQLMLTYEWSDWRNGVFWWVQSVYIDPAWRRQGIYRTLYNYVVGRAKQDSTVCGIRLYVAQNNATAQTVYKKMGMSPSGYIVYEQDFVLDPLPGLLRSHAQTEVP